MFRDTLLPLLAGHKVAIAAVTTLALTAGAGAAVTSGVPAPEWGAPAPQVGAPVSKGRHAKNVILFVGDGMNLPPPSHPLRQRRS